MERRSFGEVLTPPGGSNRTVIPAYLNGLGIRRKQPDFSGWFSDTISKSCGYKPIRINLSVMSTAATGSNRWLIRKVR